MSDEPKGEEKKVDEDWKSQVEAEKAAANKAAPEKAAPEKAAPEKAAPEKVAAEDSAKRPLPPLPPPNLVFLASTMYLQGMVSLGMLPNPATDKAEVHLDQAKHAIDTLDMLQAKTEGNRTHEETEEIERMLHELRLAFVGVQEQGMMNSE